MQTMLESKQSLKRVRQIFNLLDIDNSGTLSLEELQKGYRQHLNKYATDKDIKEIFNKADTDNSGHLDWREFVELAMNKERFLSKEFLLHTFNEFDKDGSGSLDAGEIKNVLGMINKTLMEDSVATKIIG